MGRGRGAGGVVHEYLGKHHTGLYPVIYSFVLTKITKTYNLSKKYDNPVFCDQKLKLVL